MVRAAVIAALAAVATAMSVKRLEATQEELFTIELAPGVTQVVTEEEKWALKAEGKNFIDITNHPNLASSASGLTSAKAAAVTYPTTLAQRTTVNTLTPKLSQANLRTDLTTFSNFNNRYYQSTTGRQSSDWLLSRVQAIITASGASGITVAPFAHSFTQRSIIATIPGRTANKVIVGAHQDSINLSNRVNGRAPGADDDGSGSVTILDAFRVLLTDSRIAAGQAVNTIEFHWYAGEEGGLLGSGDVFDSYASRGAVVKAMLQQDMVGYEAGPMGMITDNVDAGLTAFLRRVITAYTTVGYVDTQCGYGCSDHASARAAGYPSAFVFESAFERSSPYIHTASDTISTVSFPKMIEHGKVILGYAYELAFATL